MAPPARLVVTTEMQAMPKFDRRAMLSWRGLSKEASMNPTAGISTTSRNSRRIPVFAAIAATLIIASAAGRFSITAAHAQSAIAEQEAHAIGVDAYIYFYPLVTMDVTRRQFTNIPPGKELGKGPMNMFNNVPTYPPADFKGVVRANFDTLYSIAYLDMTKEPVVVSVPDTNGRYYLLPMLDMWSDVFASPGWRTTGTQAGNFLVTLPGWRPDLRDKVHRRVQAAEGHPAHRSSDALCVGHRPHQDRWTGGL
jgi:hypothetical protein